MANYMGYTRTNYFHVVSEDAFNEFANHLVADEDEVKTFKNVDENGDETYGFYAYSPIHYVENVDDDDWYEDLDDDIFVQEAQKIVAPDDAIIITEVGHEKMRYLVGYTLVITSTAHRGISLSNESVNAARELLNNPQFETQLDY